MACFSRNRRIRHRFPVHLTIILPIVLFLVLAVSGSYAQDSLDGDIAKALSRIVKCEKIEIKTKGEGNIVGKLNSLLIRFVAMPKQVLPADYVTVQYTNPDVDVNALKKTHKFKIRSHSNFKIGMLVSEQTIRNEFNKRAKKAKLQYNKFLIRFTPPYIELEFDMPAAAIPSKDRKLVEKFVRDKRLEGYAALRLEVRDNMIFATPAKVILNHFLLPMPIVTELKKRMNPLFRIPVIKPFDYDLKKVDVMKQYVLFSN